LAALKLQLQTLRQRKLDPEKQQQILGRSQKESQRLQLLVEDLLLTARMDSGKGRLTIEELDVSEIVDGLVQDHYSDQLGATRISSKVGPDCNALCDQQAIISITTNLIDNALKYSGSDSFIEVRVEKDVDIIILSVMDNGPGIPEMERSRIFDRFYRAGNEETRRAKGTGLGLYIVSRLVEEMNGNISLVQGHPSGCHIKVVLPAI